MKTAEELFKGYLSFIVTHADVPIILSGDFKDALAEHDKEIKDMIPSTFYAGLKLEERLKMLVSAWQRAIEVNHQLQKENNELKEKI